MSDQNNQKKALDLDAMLEEVVSKLRPVANQGCGRTNIYGTQFATVIPGGTTCLCDCCGWPRFHRSN
jgi:hypothetical protein